MKTVGLALGGGGARGMAHIVYLKALEELGIKPTIIAGTSIGAIIGAMFAAGINADEMADIVSKFNLLNIGKLVDFSFFQPSGLIKGDKVMDFLKEHIKASVFEELDIPLKIVAADFWERKQVVAESGELIPAIRASMSIPGIFNPYVKDGQVLIDGGVINPLPYHIIRNDCDVLIAIDVTGFRVPPSSDKIVPNAFQCTMEAIDIAQVAIIERQLRNLKPNIYVRPKLINIEIMDFPKSKEILESCQKEKEPFKRLVEKAMKPRLFPFHNC